MSICKEIEIKVSGVSEYFRNPVLAFLDACQEYYYYYQMNEACESVIQVLTHYLDAEEQINDGNKKNKESSKKKSLPIVNKLHIEFLWNIYKNHFAEKTEKDFFEEIIYNYEKREKFIKRFLDADKDTIFWGYINSHVEEWEDNYENCNKIKDLKLENVHHSIEILKEAFKIPMPTKEESVEDIIRPEILSQILDFLNAKNYPACVFTVAPITRALTVGATKKYSADKENRFFTLNFLYNLEKLKIRIEGLKQLLEDYNEAKEEIEEKLKICLK